MSKDGTHSGSTNGGRSVGWQLQPVCYSSWRPLIIFRKLCNVCWHKISDEFFNLSNPLKCSRVVTLELTKFQVTWLTRSIWIYSCLVAHYILIFFSYISLKDRNNVPQTFLFTGDQGSKTHMVPWQQLVTIIPK